MNILLMMMGGQGVRFGAEIPKQYVLIDHQPLFSYIVKRYAQMEDIDRMILVSHQDWVDYVQSEVASYQLQIPWDVVSGGNTRSESVIHGLSKAMEYQSGDDLVLLHDATHPYVDEDGTREVISAARKYGGATLGGREYDTMYQTDENGFIAEVIPRHLVVSGASPEAFRLQEIYSIYMNASQEELNSMTSAGAIALKHRIAMKVIPTKYLNLKITHPDDMGIFKLLIHYFFHRKKE